MGLTFDLNVAMQSLLATSESMDTTTTNIANMNTAGYARRRVVLEESAPVGVDGNSGVDVRTVQSLRDAVLDLSINRASAEQSFSNTVTTTLSPVETAFSDTASNSIGSTMDSFFNSLQQLSTSPSDGALRAGVLNAAKNVAAAFQSTASLVTDTQHQADLAVVRDTNQANSLLQQIASTNGVITRAKNLGQSCNSTEDQLASLLSQLSEIMDYQTISSPDGLTLTTENGTPLVVGNKAYALTNALDSEGYNSVLVDGVDITSAIQSGSLGGYLVSRDQSLGDLRTQLDEFAFQFAQQINAVQTTGSDASGNAGAEFFNPPDTSSGSPQGAAATIAVALTSGAQIAAAATGGATGDNTNLRKMIGLQSQAIINGSTPTDAFSSLSFSLGNTIAEATTNATATGNILTQLKNQQGSIEGVSIDEESANLVLYERSYQAAAKVISIIDTLMGNVLDMGVNNPGY